jgi:hypothetical protein
MYMVSFFSGENNNFMSVFKATVVIWGLSVLFHVFEIRGF